MNKAGSGVSGGNVSARGVFITGTDTGVGKTYLGVRLARLLLRKGVRVAARKPVESGCPVRDGELIPRDALALHEAAGGGDSLERVCPYRYEPPISPERAALLQGRPLLISALSAACTAPDGQFLLVEGAGGFYSPLAADGLNADLARALGLPVLVVSADRLGCINHTLLTLEAIHTNGLDTVGVMLNHNEPPSGDSQMDNVQDLRRQVDCPVITIAHEDDGTESLMPLIFRLRAVQLL